MSRGSSSPIKSVTALSSSKVWAPVPGAGTSLGLEGSEEAAQCAHLRGLSPVLP